jgi:catalase
VWEPEAGIRTLPDEELESKSADYLQEELAERLAAGQVRFTLRVRLAADGDPLDDPTVPWPDDRTTVTLGTMELTALDMDRERGDDVVVFDPTRVTDGVECSDDEILATRPRAYAVSIERRTKARAG